MNSSGIESNRAPASIQSSGAEQALTQPEVETCWQSIGVYGNKRCDKLAEFIHCRNCPVYSAAARHLLDRPLPANYRQEWATHLAKKENQARPAKTSVVLFRIHAEWLALPAEVFQEIAEKRLVHSLPHRRMGIVVGLVNIRGELLICVSLARLLGLEQIRPQSNRNGAERLLVSQWQSHRLVFPVDEVHGIYRFQSAELRETPATVAKASASYTQGVFFWNKRPVGYLQPSPLFSALNRSLT